MVRRQYSLTLPTHHEAQCFFNVQRRLGRTAKMDGFDGRFTVTYIVRRD